MVLGLFLIGLAPQELTANSIKENDGCALRPTRNKPLGPYYPRSSYEITALAVIPSRTDDEKPPQGLQDPRDHLISRGDDHG